MRAIGTYVALRGPDSLAGAMGPEVWRALSDVTWNEVFLRASRRIQVRLRPVWRVGRPAKDGT